MKREDVSRILRQMEHVRMLSYEAETRVEEKKLLAEYSLMWESIEPYVNGTKLYSE